MSWKFNPPPGWPAQPEGWVPPPGWVPDPSWPPPPAGWQFWAPAGATPTSTPPAAAPPPAAPPPAGPPPPASGAPGFSSAPPPPFASAAPPFSAGPVSSGPPTPFASPGPPAYAAAAKPRRPWIGQWWGILGLIAALLIGAAAGYGVTRAALNASDDSDTNSLGDLDAAASQSPLAGPEAGPEAEQPGLPSVPPIDTPSIDVSTACVDVSVIMLTMTTTQVVEGDPAAYAEAVVDSRRTAAEELRAVEGADPDEQAALDEFADEVDAAAEMVEDDPGNADTLQASFDRVNVAYDTFYDEHCI